MFDVISILAGIGLRDVLFKNRIKELQKTLEADVAATVIGASLVHQLLLLLLKVYWGLKKEEGVDLQ